MTINLDYLAISPPSTVIETTSPVSITDLVSDTIPGIGVFDKLMKAVEVYVQKEFDKGRLTGKDYATVYLGSISAVLNASVQFLIQGKQLEFEIKKNLQEIEKLSAETGLLRQKTASELANTCNHIPAGLAFNNTTEVQGTADRQNNLYEAQTDGFSRDAEQKLAKMLIDTWTVRRTTDSGTIASPSNGLDDSNILSIVNKAKAGIGL